VADTWDDIYTCPICKSTDCVPVYGDEDSKILIVGEFPGRDEIKSGRPFAGATGAILKSELGKFGIDLHRIRTMNLWLHLPNKNEDCLEYGASLVVKEAKGKQAILLIGSDTLEYFCDLKVHTVTGLEVKSNYFSAPLVMACIQPAQVFHGTVGELRLSLRKFSQRIEGLL
jgi:uracil-DNA glycosylase family 4